MLRAYCFASGHIEFGRKVPKGAIRIASGPAVELRDFICSVARHGYSTEIVDGRPTKIPGSDTLLVPGIPETKGQQAKGDKLEQWLDWIASHGPVDIAVNYARKRCVGRPSVAGRGSPSPGVSEHAR
jgi:hypothetical protein